jgi:hypothetical protein
MSALRQKAAVQVGGGNVATGEVIALVAARGHSRDSPHAAAPIEAGVRVSPTFPPAQNN